ncbi:carbonyl reductase 3 [Panicum miliaceum]|uniref:Carbonyl reductase 3 n=1 Tax=Panicum miliaceum TaxID=4540 RepID=A0A3L6SAP6_PANMI|nr:carbonyl reductase 3 [Panicum miliaceum]
MALSLAIVPTRVLMLLMFLEVNNAGIVGLEYLHDHIDGASTNDEEKYSNRWRGCAALRRRGAEAGAGRPGCTQLSEARVDAVGAAFARDLEAGAAAAAAGLNAYSRVLARRYPALRVNCVHPGFVRTDMTVNFGLLPPEEGAGRVVAVALLPAGGPTGAYFQDRQLAPFV